MAVVWFNPWRSCCAQVALDFFPPEAAPNVVYDRRRVGEAVRKLVASRHTGCDELGTKPWTSLPESYVTDVELTMVDKYMHVQAIEKAFTEAAASAPKPKAAGSPAGESV